MKNKILIGIVICILMYVLYQLDMEFVIVSAIAGFAVGYLIAVIQRDCFDIQKKMNNLDNIENDYIKQNKYLK